MSMSNDEKTLREELAKRGYSLVGPFCDPFVLFRLRCNKGHVWETACPVLYSDRGGCRYCVAQKLIKSHLDASGVTYIADYKIPQTNLFVEWGILIGTNFYAAGLDENNLKILRENGYNTIKASPLSSNWIPSEKPRLALPGPAPLALPPPALPTSGHASGALPPGVKRLRGPHNSNDPDVIS